MMAWRPRLATMGHAAVIGAAVFAVTGAADVLLAVWSREPWPPAVASVLILAPGLYLAGKAVPGPGRLSRGRPAAAWDPVDLDVHEVMGGGPLPRYFRRPHDDVLDALLDPEVKRSRLVAIRGGSSTGKSRAAYEATAKGRLATWRLEYPLNAADLEALLKAGIPARTVLWLNELPRYTNGDDGGDAVLGALARLLETQDRVIAVTTMWPEHWSGYVEAARARDGLSRDSAGTAGRLLTRLADPPGREPSRADVARGGVVEVPETFTAPEVIAAAAAEHVLAAAAHAAASAGHDGQIAQYLAGVPDLLNRFQGPGGNLYGQAVITAAMDAARLGCEAPLPKALLLDAAPGYLASPDRTRETTFWAGPAMAWATQKLRGAVQAVQPVPPPQATGIVGYRPADYLDQHGRRTRQHKIGPAELWDALALRVTATADLIRLGFTAETYGLYRHAAVFWTNAAAQGSANAAAKLIQVLRRASPSGLSHAARWTVAHVSLADPRGVALLLSVLHETGAGDAVAALLARDPAASVSVDDPRDVARLLGALREAGADHAATALADRAAASTTLNDPSDVLVLLWELRRTGAGEAATAVAYRAAASITFDNLLDFTLLLERMREAGADDAANALVARAAASITLDNPWHVADLLRVLREAGADDAATALLARDPAASADLDKPIGAATLLWELREAGADDAATALLARAPAVSAIFDKRINKAFLLQVMRERMREAGADRRGRHPGRTRA